MNMLWIWIQDSEEGETRHDHERDQNGQSFGNRGGPTGSVSTG